MASSHLLPIVGAVLLAALPSKAEVRYGANAVASRSAARQGGAVAARAEQGGGFSAQAVSVSPAMMTAGGRAASPTSAMNAFGGSRRPAAWRGISMADSGGDAGLPPVRYGFYPGASQPPHDTRKAVNYQSAPAASPSYEPPMPMIVDEARAAMIPSSPGSGMTSAPADQTVTRVPVREGTWGSEGGGSLYNVFLGGAGGGSDSGGGAAGSGTHNRDQGGKPIGTPGKGGK